MLIVSIIVSLVMVFSACSSTEMPSVEREDLFRLNIGKMEDEIDLFSLEDRPKLLRTRILMDDGIFYISDTNAAKVVRFTSYGDLLSMIYNAELNPPPLSLSTDIAADGLYTRKAIAYPLNEPGSIALDSQKKLYVENRLPPERRLFDSERRVLLDRVVVRFTADGQNQDYLGQEGVGGTPFPFIDGLYISANDDLAVVCRLGSNWSIYWFDDDGNLLYIIAIDINDLPKDEASASLVLLDSIFVAPDKRQLFMKLDYYHDSIDSSTETRAGIGHRESMVWLMDIATGEYLDRITVPSYEYTETVNNRRTVANRLYSFLGAAKNGKLLFSTPDTGGYAILVLEIAGSQRKRGFIKVADDELVYNCFHLSSDGLLSALLASEFEAKIVWWRTDNLLGEPRA